MSRDNIAKATAAASTARRGRPRGSKNKPKERKPTQRLGLRVNEFVEAFGVSRSTVTRLIADGTIKAIKIGGTPIIPQDEVQRLLSPR
jgi:excisionase family DNA binding protein